MPAIGKIIINIILWERSGIKRTGIANAAKNGSTLLSTDIKLPMRAGIGIPAKMAKNVNGNCILLGMAYESPKTILPVRTIAKPLMASRVAAPSRAYSLQI